MGDDIVQVGRQGGQGEPHHPHQTLEGSAQHNRVGGAGQGGGEQGDKGIQHLQLLSARGVKLVVFQGHMKQLQEETRWTVSCLLDVCWT